MTEDKEEPKTEPTVSESAKPEESPVEVPVKNSKTLVTVVVILGLITLGLLVFIILMMRQGTRVVVDTAVSPKVIDNSVNTQKDAIDDGTVWTKPEKLADLGWVKAAPNDIGNEYKSTEYYKVGTTKDGEEIIVVKINLSGIMDFTVLERFLRKDKAVIRLVKNSDALDTTFPITTTGFTDDSTRLLPALLVDPTITQGATKLVALELGWFPTSTSEVPVGKRVLETKWGDLMLVTKEMTANAAATGLVKVGQYYIVLKDSTVKYFEPKPTFIADDSSADVTWSNSAAQAAYDSSPGIVMMPTGGCGMGIGTFPVVAGDALLSDKQAIAKSSSGSSLYRFGTAGEKIMQFGYDLYASAPGESGAGTYDAYKNEAGLVVWVDDFGTPLVYAMMKWLPQAECGKPVVYLYPTKPTDFTVQVGAKITKSLPEYLTGWSGTAYPDGHLVVNGQTYPNLFWEGLGYGLYPTVTSGTVVESKTVESTLRNQMSAMGLNATEINDFMDFWLPKMPTTTYTRLTWFGTEEMNRLAPLKVTPKPDSVIRVFLDFEGSDTMINVSEQILPHYSREGYTLVEWGGLLR